MSAFFSYFLPLELFLFSYAILGPLHYLTELSWLKDRGFFIPQRCRRLAVVPLLLLLVMLATIFNFCLPSTFGPLSAGLMALALSAAALSVAKLRSWLAWSLYLTAAAFCVYFSYFNLTSLIILTVFLPTIIHVFFFTLSFVIAGARKRQDLASWLSAGLMVTLASLLLFWPAGAFFPSGAYARAAYQPFFALNSYLSMLLGQPVLNTQGNTLANQFSSPAACGVMRFIAFAYTYHYLNWFAKTRIIGWSRVSRRRQGAIAVAWAVAVGTYLYDYQLGTKLLWTLSFGHVLMELPLNAATLFSLLRLPLEKREGERAEESRPVAKEA